MGIPEDARVKIPALLQDLDILICQLRIKNVI